MKVLGISPFHDSSAVVIDNGSIDLFLKEERLSRIKRDFHPFLSIDECCRGREIDLAVISSPTNGDYSLYPYYHMLRKKYKVKEIVDMSDEHHLQHASLAFYNSGFEESLIFVIDRNGSFVGTNARESESVFIAKYPAQFEVLYKNFWLINQQRQTETIEDIQQKYKKLDHSFLVRCNSTHGIVKVYESATNLIRQPILENGKTMGLSAYGSNSSRFGELVQNGVGNMSLLSHGESSLEQETFNKSLYHLSVSEVTKDNYKLYADYALAVQKQTQEAALQLIEHFVKTTKINKVCITGGYGLNVVANAYYVDKLPNVDFYFEPLADDSGNSIGGALYQYRLKTQDTEIRPISSTFFHGKSLAKQKNYNKSIYETSTALQQQKTVAIYYSNAEAGPRALGHRSILFDARNPNAKEIVNRVKKREWYRPFAAIVLKEDAEKLFDIDSSNRNYKFMTLNAKTRMDMSEIPGVLHVDRTCRIQIVEDETEPVYKLLSLFKQVTGLGILLNTSFNLAGEPLVETLEDAVRTLQNSDLDLLWIPEEDRIIGG